MDQITAWMKEKWQLLMGLLLGLVVLLILMLFFIFTRLKQHEFAPESENDVLEELMDEKFGEDLVKEVETTSLTDSQKETLNQSSPDEIIVDIKGEVNAPGVYQMDTGKRVIDVINKAGGLLPHAETTAVNFAQIVTDQMIIYIPQIGEEGPHIESPVQTVISNEEKSAPKININTAEKEALMSLNGIGSSKAENILSYREEHGSFNTIEDIKNVSGIGEATFNNLKENITVGP